MRINKLFRDRNEPERVMDTWSEVGLVSNLNLNGEKNGKIRKKSHFLPFFGSRCELEREMRETPPSLYDLRRSGGQNQSSQDFKFIYSTRAMRGYRQHAISSKISCLEKKS